IAPRAAGERYQLGVGLDGTAVGQRIDTLGPLQAIAVGASRATATTTGTFAFIGKLFTGRESVRDNVGGPLMIAKQSKEAADRGARQFWEFVAYLSIALAVFNILPIPALDGGHLVFLAYEAVVRREPSLKVRMVVQQVGVALILALMVFVIFNDAVRWFG
ncbi:site-2 protease family protein, partial [Rubrivirga sp.]|uniref:site-2 protease family protein n=1 Tax=Rubrivirga sp. TaxID=1885344 RepID=UPI003C7136D8